MDFSIKQLGLIVIAIAAILLTALLVGNVVSKTETKVNSEMDKLNDIPTSTTEYIMPVDSGLPEAVFYC